MKGNRDPRNLSAASSDTSKRLTSGVVPSKNVDKFLSEFKNPAEHGGETKKLRDWGWRSFEKVSIMSFLGLCEAELSSSRARDGTLLKTMKICRGGLVRRG